MEVKSDSIPISWQDMDRKMEETTVPGVSLAGTQLSTLMNTGTWIVCGMVIQNWTNMELSVPQSTINSGSLSKPPCNISPGQREAVIAHKYSFSLRGSSGIMSWLLGMLERRVVVLWDVPISSTNQLAVGITTKGSVLHNPSWFGNIESKSDPPELNVKRGQYYNTCNEIMIEDDCIQVFGSMGTGSRPEVNIIIRPKLYSLLALKGE